MEWAICGLDPILFQELSMEAANMTPSNIENILTTWQGKVFNTMREMVYMYYPSNTKVKMKLFQPNSSITENSRKLRSVLRLVKSGFLQNANEM